MRSPDEVVQREFRRVFRGYDPTEVDDFLTLLAADLDAARQREADLRAQLARAERELVGAQTDHLRATREVEALGERLRLVDQERLRIEETLRAADSGARKILADAERSRADLLASAESQARGILDRAHVEAERVRRLQEETVARLKWEAALAEEHRRHLDGAAQMLAVRLERLRSALERCRQELAELLEPPKA